MPAKSKAQQELFAIAEHKPDILYDKNKRILGDMSHDQIRDFAKTKVKDKPVRVQPKQAGPKKVQVKPRMI